MTPEQNLRMQGFLGHHKKYPKQKMEPPTIHDKKQGELNRSLRLPPKIMEFGSDIMAIINLPTS